jgi:epoxyqueuosine reductase
VKYINLIFKLNNLISVNLLKNKVTALIKQKALEIGFNAVGISKAEKIDGFSQKYHEWIKAGYHAGMEYMERNIEKRENPTKLVEQAKTVISLLTSYYPEQKQPTNIPQIAKYAYGVDYHFVIKDMMKELWNFTAELFPELNGRIFVDSAPVPDKYWAVKSGLGWIGKNSCLINKSMGSFVFICELIINIELEYDTSFINDYCGTCTKCIEACPTNAIISDRKIDSNRCISYQTIENKSETIPDELKGKFSNRLFGCDICQDVCPWNKNPVTTKIEQFKPDRFIFSLTKEKWKQMDNIEFNKLFKKSPLKRAKLSGIKRNLKFIE